MRIHKAVCFLGILWLGIAGLAGADVVADDAMRVAVEGKLDKAKIASVVNGGGPRVEAKDGVVTLTGSVKSIWAKTRAIELAMDVEGVDMVEDELEIAFAESDEALVEALSKAILRYPHFTIFDDVTLGINEGNVVLNGRVTMPFKSDEIERRIAKVTGVQSLANEIETLPVNTFDERIRANLAYRIYNDTLFQRFAFRANPPIHIVVERGNVALTGAVNTEIEKRKAGIIARQTFGVFQVDNRLTVGD